MDLKRGGLVTKRQYRPGTDLDLAKLRRSLIGALLYLDHWGLVVVNLGWLRYTIGYGWGLVIVRLGRGLVCCCLKRWLIVDFGWLWYGTWCRHIAGGRYRGPRNRNIRHGLSRHPPETSRINSSPPREGHVIEQSNMHEASGESYAGDCKNR